MQVGSWRVGLGLAALASAGIAQAGAELKSVEVNDGLFLTPSLKVEQKYDDNIYQSDDDEVDSGITVLAPAVVFDAQRENTTISLSYAGEYGFFWDSGDDDYDDHLIRGDLAFAGSRTSLDVYAYYEREHEDRGTGVSNGLGGGVQGNPDILTSVFDEPTEYSVQRINAQFGLGTDSSRVRAVLGIDAFSKEYENFRTLTRDRDRDVTEPSLTVQFEATGKTAFDVQVSQREIEYDQTPASGISLDSEETRFTVGVEWQATGATTGSIRLGGVDKEFDDSRRDDFSGIIADAQVIWEPMTYSQVVFGLNKGPRETDGQGDAIDVTSFSVNWGHDWNARTRTNAGLTLTSEEYEGNSRDDDFTAFNASVEYNFRPNIGFEAGLRISNRDSSQDNTDFDRSVVFVSLTAGL